MRQMRVIAVAAFAGCLGPTAPAVSNVTEVNHVYDPVIDMEPPLADDRGRMVR